MDRTKALHGPRTQAYGETRYSDKKRFEVRKMGYWIKISGYFIHGLNTLKKKKKAKANKGVRKSVERLNIQSYKKAVHLASDISLDGYSSPDIKPSFFSSASMG